jgi:hypothetical protein
MYGLLAMPSIVISYRRADSAGTAGRIFDKLVSKFGYDAIFMDIDNRMLLRTLPSAMRPR